MSKGRSAIRLRPVVSLTSLKGAEANAPALLSDAVMTLGFLDSGDFFVADLLDEAPDLALADLFSIGSGDDVSLRSIDSGSLDISPLAIPV